VTARAPSALVALDGQIGVHLVPEHKYVHIRGPIVAGELRHCARAALAVVAALLRTGQAKVFTKRIERGRTVVDKHPLISVIDARSHTSVVVFSIVRAMANSPYGQSANAQSSTTSP
jgi:hypothetical protein